MTEKFDSKEDAIMTGLHYAGRDDLYDDGKGGKKSLEDILKNQDIKIIDADIIQFDYIHKDTIMIEFENDKKIKVRIATTKFRDGFDLWFINPETGASVRM